MSHRKKLAEWYLSDAREVQSRDDFPVGLVVPWVIVVRQLTAILGA